MLQEALIVDATGRPIRHDGRTHSSNWDEVQEFCRNVYMPYRVMPLDPASRPDATLIRARAGQVILTRFSYGTGIHLDRFDPDAGNVLVLNTLQGALRHQADRRPATTRAGESFVVDCSRTDYWLDGDPDHMQFNLTIPHKVLEETAARWFGFVPDDALWTRRVKIGGPGSPWQSLLDYVARSLTAHELAASADSSLGRHLEEVICVALLREWAAQAGVSLERGQRTVAPHYVRQAEEILSAEARHAPAIGEVARRVGVSARALSNGFQRFRGQSPRAFLIARRLDGLRADLQAQPASRSIAQVAADWGYANFGAMAGQYRARFGERPSETRARAIKRG